MSSVTNHALALYKSFKSRQTIGPIRDAIGNDIETAYAIQKKLIQQRIADGERVVGKKIGLTSPAVQAQLGVDQPDYGVLFDTMDRSATRVIHMRELMQPKVEGELTFVLGADILDPEVEMEALKKAIKEVRASIEIVGSRIDGWNIQISDTIADNASGSHFVIGADAKSLAEVDTAAVKMVLSKNGEVASEGTGTACMGDPLNAALWLARTMAKNGQPLRRGEVLLSGALGPMVPVEEGDVFALEVSGFETLAIRFEA